MTERKTTNVEEKRALAREARRKGIAPSAAGATTGAPQQRKHLGHKADHEQKLAERHRNQPPPHSRQPNAD